MKQKMKQNSEIKLQHKVVDETTYTCVQNSNILVVIDICKVTSISKI